MKCAVVMPVGPGHELLALDAQDSVHAAFNRAPGLFTALEMLVIDDTAAALGRSQARNNAVAAAAAAGIEWIFFLDADDILCADAFAVVAPYLAQYDAVWGAIAELGADEESGLLRAEQLATIGGIETLLTCDPYGLLQIGHFVKTAVALANPFDSALDAGEDFDYYLRVWAAHTCIKIAAPLFYNRRGMHSTGPRSASGRQWREAVQKIVCRACVAHDFHADFTQRGVALRFYISNPYDSVQRTLLKSRFFEAAELDYVEQWIGGGAHIIEVGAYVGNHAVYYLRYLQPAALTVFEPNAEIVALLERNLAANRVDGLTPVVHALAAGRAAARYDAVSRDPNNQGATRLVAAADGAIQAVPLDEIVKGAVDFIKIDAEGMELEVLEGAARIVRESRPKIMIEIFNDHHTPFAHWLQDHGYRIVQTFKYVNATNYMIEAAQ